MPNHTNRAVGPAILCVVISTTGASLPGQGNADDIVVDLGMEMGRPVVEAKVNGKGPFRFVLDTGAGSLILNSDLVRELGVVETGTTRVGDPSSPTAIEATEYKIESVAIGGATFSEMVAISWDDETIRNGIGDVRGILGLQALSDYVVVMDFPNGKLRLSKEPLTPTDGSIPFSLDLHSIPTIDITVDGQRVKSHIDTGNFGDLSLPKRLMKKLKLKGEPMKAHARTASGTFELLVAQLDGDVTIAGQTIRNPEVHFNDRFDWGNIGTGIVSRFIFSIDQKNQRILLAPTGAERRSPTRRVVAGPALNPPNRRYGIMIVMSSQGPMEVQGAVPGSIAEKAGLRKGDKIISINGQEVASLGMSRRGELLRESPVTMLVERNGRKIEIRMSLD